MPDYDTVVDAMRAADAERVEREYERQRAAEEVRQWRFGTRLLDEVPSGLYTNETHFFQVDDGEIQYRSQNGDGVWHRISPSDRESLSQFAGRVRDGVITPLTLRNRTHNLGTWIPYPRSRGRFTMVHSTLPIERVFNAQKAMIKLHAYCQTSDTPTYMSLIVTTNRGTLSLRPLMIEDVGGKLVFKRLDLPLDTAITHGLSFARRGNRMTVLERKNELDGTE